MLQQVFLDSRYADFTYDSGEAVHWLADPLQKPDGFFFKVHVLSAWIPLTYYNVYPGNNRLDLAYSPTESQSIELPVGNRDVDEIVAFLNEKLLNGFAVRYDPATNRLVLEGGSTAVQISGSTTCHHLLGFRRGDVAFGGLAAEYGVDLTRTTSILLRSNLHGTNRDPFTRRMGDILCKIPVSHQQPNEIIEYTQPAFIRVTNPSLTYFSLALYDDDGVPLDLNGNRWTVTLQVSIERDEAHVPGIPRYIVENEQGPEGEGTAKGESKGEA